jgi:hypothetical protein
VAYPEPGQEVDDGSFQLKGFRHVSGMSDVEGSGGLEGYMGHVKRHSTVSALEDQLAQSPVTIDTPISATGIPQQNTTRTRPVISRPPSIAGSLASVDDLISTSNRVSVATFRRGIRRPSDGPVTMSDLGHGARGDMDDGDDDLPLGMIGRGMRTRDASAHSLHSMKPDGGDRRLSGGSPNPSPRPSPVPTPSPGLGTDHERRSRHVRNGQGSGGFIVKSAISTRASMACEGEKVNQARDRMGETTLPSSYGITNRLVSTSPVEIVASPVNMSPDQGYFTNTAPAQFSVQRMTQLQAVSVPITSAHTSTKPDMPRLTTSPKAPPPPSVKSLQLPGPDDLSIRSETPASMRLPLPPDQMPDTPPKQPSLLPSPPFPARGQRKLSLLEEPIRAISGLWSAQTTSQKDKENQPLDDGFDANLVLQSMAILGGGEDDLRPISRATLFDASSIASVERSRSPLSTRLANVASVSSLRQPSLGKPRVNGEFGDGVGTERLKSPSGEISDSGTALPVITKVVNSSFARAPRHKRSTTGLSKGWSSSDDSDDGGGRSVKSTKVPVNQAGSGPGSEGTRRTPSGPRKISSRIRPGQGVRGRSLPKKLDTDNGDDSDDGSDSSEEESLSVLRAKASRSNLAVTQHSSPALTTAALPNSTTPLLPNVATPPQVFTQEPTKSVVGKVHGASGPYSTSITAVQAKSTSPPDRRRVVATMTTSASPASSQSGLTSDSNGTHPVTPKESSEAGPINNPSNQPVSVITNDISEES